MTKSLVKGRLKRNGALKLHAKEKIQKKTSFLAPFFRLAPLQKTSAGGQVPPCPPATTLLEERFTVNWMARMKVQVLVRISLLDVKVCEKLIVLNHDINIKEVDPLLRIGRGKFDGLVRFVII